MLKLVIEPSEFFDEVNERFVITKETTLKLEHSLLSISKWESKWEKPFLTDEPKPPEMLLDYVKFMTLSSVSESVYTRLTQKHMDAISEYIASKQTATTFTDDGKESKAKKQIITSEVIYAWMASAQIPWECERWHINRLLTLIKVYSIHNTPPDKTGPKVGKRQQAMDRAELNRKRKEMYKTKG